MLYQLSYASSKPHPNSVRRTESCADTLLLSAYHGTEIKVSIAAFPEQTQLQTVPAFPPYASTDSTRSSFCERRKSEDRTSWGLRWSLQNALA
jgi:hypothetical protein